MDSLQREEKVIQIEKISDILFNSFQYFPENQFIGKKLEKSFEFKTYNQIENIIENLSKYLIEQFNLDINIYNEFIFNEIVHKMIGIYTKPCREALITILAIHNTNENLTALPISENINQNELKIILNESQIKTLIIDKDCLKILINHKDILKKSKIKNLILIFNEENEQFLSENKSELIEINIIKFEDLIENFNHEIAAKEEEKISKNSSNFTDRIIILNYTSNLKGIMISEKTLIDTYNNLINTNLIKTNQEDIYYSLTSLGDTVEYINILQIISNGGSIGFFSGDCTQILNEIKILQPSIIYSYPRILTKIYEALSNIISKLDEAKKTLIEKAIKAKVDHCNEKNSLNHHIWDKLLFNKIKNSLGGRIRLILIGGGHLDCHIFEFLKICLSTQIIEIYGLSEACGIVTLTNEANKFLGTHLISTDIKIKKCNKIGYFSHSQNSHENVKDYGEICIKGDNLFSGYFNQINEFLDDEGYFHTGDYAITYDIENSHFFKFIDKIENFITTKQGYLISPLLLEQFYILSEFITSITIISDYESELIGVVILNKNKNNKNDIKEDRKRKMSDLMYKNGERKNNIIEKKSNSTKDYEFLKLEKANSYDSLMINPNDNDTIIEDIKISFKNIWIKYKLKNYELISKIFILEKEPSSNFENGILTTKLKLKRENIKKIYLEYLEDKKFL